MECRKVKYMTQAAADSMVRWMVEVRKAGVKKATRHLLHSYLCRFCGFWHVGHVKWRRRRRRLRKGA